VRHFLEIVLQHIFPKIHARCLQEAVLEIVQIPHHGTVVELGQWVTDAEIQTVGTPILEVGQEGDGSVKQLFLLVTENARGTSPLDKIEEHPVSQILLKVKHLIVGDSKHAGHVQSLCQEMACQGDESAVFIPRFSIDPYKRTVIFGETEIFAVGARGGESFQRRVGLSCMGSEKGDEWLHVVKLKMSCYSVLLFNIVPPPVH
jgi:hypothetical protein